MAKLEAPMIFVDQMKADSDVIDLSESDFLQIGDEDGIESTDREISANSLSDRTSTDLGLIDAAGIHDWGCRFDLDGINHSIRN
jgi:hypothetical protein